MTTTRPQSRTLGDLLDELAAATPQAPAVVSGTEVSGIVRLDFAGLKARTDGFARALLALGIGRGDRVALLCSNRSEWVVAACAAAKLGAPVAAISTFSSPRELAYALKHSGAKALVMLSRFRDRHFLQELADGRGKRGRLKVVGGNVDGDVPGHAHQGPFRLVAEGPAQDPRRQRFDQT